MTKSYRDLIVWQKAIDLTVLIYELTKSFPKEELYGLSNQMRRCAVSIPSNIAEGAGRLNKAEYRQFLGIARGSSFELQTQLILVQKLGLGDGERIVRADELCNEIGKMTVGAIKTLNEEPEA